MEAWEYESERFYRAAPLEERTYEDWDKAFKSEKERDEAIKEEWLGFVPGSGAPVRLITATIQAVENLGYRVQGWQEPVERGFSALERGDIPALIEASIEVRRAIRQAEKDPASEYWNYRRLYSFQEYAAASGIDELNEGPDSTSFGMEETELFSKILGSWTGQAVGDALGTAIEGFAGAQISKVYGDIESYVKPPSTLNDDITYQIVLLESVLEHGKDLTAKQLASAWAARIPYAWSAEDAALGNIMAGLLPPLTAETENPYREWIGAQMRGVTPGLLSPGNPREAARLAWMDGSISHTTNGILGEVFNALLSSFAFVERDIRNVVEGSVGLIPAGTQYGAVIRDALEACRSTDNWQEAWSLCEGKYRRYHWIHSYPNACAEIIALWFGEGDFHGTAHIVAMEGMDVDCNAAQVLAVAGTCIGVEAIPTQWTEPLGGHFDTYLRGKRRYSFDELSEKTLAAIRKIS
ncbi:MAG: ADP-ribosylglycohydrolase family protein [Spirochaetaceae bacterium]